MVISWQRRQYLRYRMGCKPPSAPNHWGYTENIRQFWSKWSFSWMCATSLHCWNIYYKRLWKNYVFWRAEMLSYCGYIVLLRVNEHYLLNSVHFFPICTDQNWILIRTLPSPPPPPEKFQHGAWVFKKIIDQKTIDIFLITSLSLPKLSLTHKKLKTGNKDIRRSWWLLRWRGLNGISSCRWYILKSVYATKFHPHVLWS